MELSRATSSGSHCGRLCVGTAFGYALPTTLGSTSKLCAISTAPQRSGNASDSEVYRLRADAYSFKGLT